MFKASSQKEVSTKLMKGLLDLIILQFLSTEPMHGYQVITKIRKNFGVYFGPSTIYPLLGTLEKKGYVDSNWNMNFERPRKVYSLTNDGQNMLNYTEDSLNLICRKITNKPRDNAANSRHDNHKEQKQLDIRSTLKLASSSRLASNFVLKLILNTQI